MKFRKKMLMMALACLIGFQPQAEAKKEDLISAIIFIGLYFTPAIISLSYKILKDLGNHSYGMYRTAKHRCGFESPALRAAKVAFMKNLDDFALNNQSDFKENCYCHLFSASVDAPKIIESFIAGQEECDPKKQLKVFGWDIQNLREKEKNLFGGIESPKDDFDKGFFIHDALKSIEQYRKNQMGRFIGVCCEAYPCEYGIEANTMRKYPNIKASMLFSAFMRASNKSNDSNKPDAKMCITTALLFACIEQEHK